jgi:NitT/TauT family transport system substrate-binding protein
MQVLSQLSYNPTDFVIGPLVGVVSVASRPDSSPDCSTGEFRVPALAGFHRSRLAVSEAHAYCSRVIASAARIAQRSEHQDRRTWPRPIARCQHCRAGAVDSHYVVIVDYLTQQTVRDGRPMRLRSTALVGAIFLAACSVGQGAQGSAPTALRLGYFPNVTHAPALVGVEQGILAEALGPDVDLRPQAFNAGPEVVEAIFNGALDASYIGPNPAINAFARSNGEAIRIVAGTTSGGAALVVRDGITAPDQLAGTVLASPQLGNTQDVALRAWLLEQGYETDLEGGGDVSITPQANGQALEAFVAGEIDGAWVPEPWATRMVEDGGGHILVDEADLWPDGAFVTTHLIVATEFLDAHPDVVKRLLEGHVAAVASTNADAEAAQGLVATAIEEISGSVLSPEILAAAWENLEFTVDPIADSLSVSAQHAAELGLLEDADLEGIYELGPLNEVLRAAGDAEIPAP